MAGALLALGAPAGLVVFRQIASGHPSVAAAAEDLVRDGWTYGYLLVSTSVVFVVLGILLGRVADRLGRTSSTDALTRLANRRYFDEQLTVELKRAKRYGSPLALLLIDVDRLKEINDRQGHDAGDRALRSVADALFESCRATDVAARWGGDEFMVLAPGIDAGGAVALARRIRETLRSLPSRSRTSLPTVSVGIADLDSSADKEAASLTAAADAALYEAKSSGRDRAVLWARPLQPVAPN
ncbi:MAG TPA: GGDEF domain-containing protein [Polyangiaceae bacterium]